MPFLQPHQESQTGSDELAGELGRWLIFSAGLAMLVAALILPARRDLIETRIERDRALHEQSYQQERIDRYASFLIDVENPDQSTLDLLAHSQLGLIPADREAISLGDQSSDPLVFAQIDPTLELFVPNRPHVSRLELLATRYEYRFWFVLIGAIAILYGLLPAAKMKPRVTTLPA